MYLCLSILLRTTGVTDSFKNFKLPYTLMTLGMKNIKFNVTNTTFGMCISSLTVLL